MFVSVSIVKKTSVAFVAALFISAAAATVAQKAVAGIPQHLVKMNRVDFQVPIQVMRDAPVKLHNNWNIPLHGTVIRQMDSGASLARIETITSGQTVTLEFPKEGTYSVCYSLGQEKQDNQNRCLFLKVIPMNAT